MKRVLISVFSFVALLTVNACTAQTTQGTSKTEVSAPAQKAEPAKPRNFAREMLQWEKDFVDYGKVKKGDTRDFTYKFKNISNQDVEIMICTACSCTTLEWTTGVIKPGETGEINTHFESKEKDASETINITIILKNTDPIMDYPIVDEVKFHFDLEQ